jgi:hypothetical protein
VSTIETDTIDTNMNTYRMRDAIKMIAHTLTMPHANTARTRTATETMNLVATTGDMPRLPMARTARVAIMLTM